MSSKFLWKGFNFCFSKLKCFPTLDYPPPAAITDQISDRGQNFSKALTCSSSTTATATEAEYFFSSDDDDRHDKSDVDWIPDFASAFASHRFFISFPGSSNSILEVPAESEVAGGVAVRTYSPDPYSDFRKSMVEMIESRNLVNGAADWEFLHELLLCYLRLNPKHTHKFIVAAFADVVVSLAAALEPPPPRTQAAGKMISTSHA